MKVQLTTRQKTLITGAFFAVAIVGFMVKLPSAFRHNDKELHAAFYFLAAAVLNVLFAGRKLAPHVVILVALFLFGLTIECAQEYSNKLFRARIHGRFDPEDVQWNAKGLIAFSLIWLLYLLATTVYNKIQASPGAVTPRTSERGNQRASLMTEVKRKSP